MKDEIVLRCLRFLIIDSNLMTPERLLLLRELDKIIERQSND